MKVFRPLLSSCLNTKYKNSFMYSYDLFEFIGNLSHRDVLIDSNIALNNHNTPPLALSNSCDIICYREMKIILYKRVIGRIISHI